MKRLIFLLFLGLTQATFASLCIDLNAYGQREAGSNDCSPLGGGTPISATFEIYDSAGNLVVTKYGGDSHSSILVAVDYQDVYTVYATSAAGVITNSPMQVSVLEYTSGCAFTYFMTCDSYYFITGIVKKDGQPLAGQYVTTNSGKTARTDALGFFKIQVSAGWSGTVYPLSGFDSDVQKYTFSDVHSNQLNCNFNIGELSYKLAGKVTKDGQPLSGVDIVASTGESVKSATDGTYTINVDPGWSGTLSANHWFYDFRPSEYSFSNVSADQPANDFTVITDLFTVGGYIRLEDGTPLPNIQVEIPKSYSRDTVFTNSEGYYSTDLSYKNSCAI